MANWFTTSLVFTMRNSQIEEKINIYKLDKNLRSLVPFLPLPTGTS